MNTASTSIKRGTTKPLPSGNEMPILALGTWELTIDTAGTTVYALELGYRHFDTSSDYGTQPGIAEGLKKSTIYRKNIFITTKVEETDEAYDRTKSNLRELELDYIDLELIHRPPSESAGEDLWEGLIHARDEGLVRDIGVSNYSIEQIEALLEFSGVTPAVNQIEWSPFGHSDEILQYCKEKKIIIQAYSPLTRARRLNDKNLNHLAEKYDKSPAQILIRWNLQLGTVPLPKANQKQHLEENIDVFNFEISTEDMQMLGSLNETYSSLGVLPYI